MLLRMRPLALLTLLAPLGWATSAGAAANIEQLEAVSAEPAYLAQVSYRPQRAPYLVENVAGGRPAAPARIAQADTDARASVELSRTEMRRAPEPGAWEAQLEIWPPPSRRANSELADLIGSALALRAPGRYSAGLADAIAQRFRDQLRPTDGF